VSAAEFRQLLAAGDVDALRGAWSRVAPHLPQPETREQAEIVMHHARTATESLELRPRAYSHRWLTERLLPSGLPDRLKPSAERLYPTVAEAVGFSANFASEWMRPAAAEVEREVSSAIEECYADGATEVSFVKSRMKEAHARTMRALFGR
jgi:hypothetical protein